MTGFVLSPSRRDELAALLGEEKRFQVEFPKVADYLATSPSLAGSGDDEGDQAFDIRLLHFMTGGDSNNPYWDIVGPSTAIGPGERRARREVSGGNPKGSARLGYAQTILQASFAYAIPSPETLRWIADATRDRGVIEVGAGRGYWAHLLSGYGLDVLAFDSEPPESVANVSFPMAEGVRAAWHHVGDLDELARVRAKTRLADRALMLCWPPGWGNRMASETLAWYTEAGGTRLIYVGEPKGGKCATDDFFDTLTEEWELTSDDSEFASWWNLNDRAQIWTKRQ